ncbi:MAG: cytochrome c maturation protein CcmE [Anaplasma sp.]
MKRKYKRALFVAASFCVMGCVLSFVLFELRKSISFFCTTSELLSGHHKGSLVRVGGMVTAGSVSRSTDSVSFDITDFKTNVRVVYSGILPPLFSEGTGAIAKGRLVDGKFIAEEVLAKHDEKYMPKRMYTTPQGEATGAQKPR